jgi:hypothetical protein
MGEMTGYGPVHLLPGILPEFVVNTQISLPLGMEAYGMWASYVWLHPKTPKKAQVFARISAFLALALGALGQVAYHLLKANGYTKAPDVVVVFVSVLPVGVAGLAMILVHMVIHGGGSLDVVIPGWRRVFSKIRLPKVRAPESGDPVVEEKTEEALPEPVEEPKPSPDPVHPKLPRQWKLQVVAPAKPVGLELNPKLSERQKTRVLELLPQARPIWAALERPSARALTQAFGGMNSAVASELARILRTENEASSAREDQVG